MVEIVAFGCEFWSGDVDAGVELELRSRLGKIIKPEEDSILFIPLCACCRGKIERIGGIAPADRSIFFA
ncbi:CRISPR-associated endonuclease Cas2 [Phormidium nigroviride]